jgi:aminoglycoside phosphotransferase (APT) family kinase protein
MDFAKGEVPSTKQALALAPQLSRILSHLHEMEGETPGSLGGDAVQGVLWPGNSLTFKDRENFENWLTRRLRRHDRSIKFEDQQLVMCHLDFVPRNMVVDDGAVTLLDWASSGYFPRIFDYIAYNFSPLDTRFFANLLPHLGTLADLEEETAKDVLQALDNCQIYFL